MGWGITVLRQRLEPLACGRPWALRVLGVLITSVVVGLSGLSGWGLERWWLGSLALVLDPAEATRPLPLTTAVAAWFAGINLLVSLAAMVVALASSLAARSLEQAVMRVLEALPDTTAASAMGSAPAASADLGGHPSGPAFEAPGEVVAPPAAIAASSGDLALARQRLAWIVGRDTQDLDRAGLVRAAAETASENAVDGLFAPLFWMLLGGLLWQMPGAPGPLSLVWGFKAASTLDSMLGYRRGSLRWLGTAGARLDDVLTWLPCRLVAFSLPLVSSQPRKWRQLAAEALRQGAADPSPNAGVSQAIYALVLGVQLGGASTYGGQVRHKPLVGLISRQGEAALEPAMVEAMLALTLRLQDLWLLLAGLPISVLFITKTLS